MTVILFLGASDPFQTDEESDYDPDDFAENETDSEGNSAPGPCGNEKDVTRTGN